MLLEVYQRSRPDQRGLGGSRNAGWVGLGLRWVLAGVRQPKGAPMGECVGGSGGGGGGWVGEGVSLNLPEYMPCVQRRTHSEILGQTMVR